MNCLTFTMHDFLRRDRPTATFIMHQLVRRDSDFARKLTLWLYTPMTPGDADGSISVVYDLGEAVGWARTERWTERFGDGSGLTWDTLEAFVASEYRNRGVASFAACGLYASRMHDNGCNVAVFAPSMLLVARRAGLFPTLFNREAAGVWRRSGD